MSDRKLYTPKATISVSRDRDYSSLSPALVANKRHSLSPSNLRECRSSLYRPGNTSVTSVGDNSGEHGLRGSLMRHSILDVGLANMEERLAKMQFFQDDRYEIKLGNKSIEFNTQDEIFTRTEPIDSSLNKGDKCCNCEKEVSNSKRQHC